MKKENILLLSLATVGVGIWLTRNPQCDRGCKTVAEHLIEHGLRDFFGTLLA